MKNSRLELCNRIRMEAEHTEDTGFPLDTFPQAVQSVILDMTKYENYMIEFIATSMLSAASTALGGTYRIRIKSDWQSNGALYIILVGRPGLGKTPPLEAAYRPIRKHDYALFKAYEAEVEEVLEMLFAGRNICYKVEGEHISVYKPQQARQNTITGLVMDVAKEPIIGASVVVMGTTNGCITDFDGKFSLEVPEFPVKLQISYIGYKSQEIAVHDTKTIQVVLREDTETLDEVVVVGYGSQKKANLTGAVASVKMDEVIGDRPLVNAAEALQGTVPGLLVSSNGNDPGQGKKFQVRGAYSVGIKNDDGSYGNTIEPLVLIDNVEGDIDMINPEDIETVTVLKDAASAAIYGARAAGGVILITTKRPKGGTSFQLNYNYNFAFSNAINHPP